MPMKKAEHSLRVRVGVGVGVRARARAKLKLRVPRKKPSTPLPTKAGSHAAAVSSQ